MLQFPLLTILACDGAVERNITSATPFVDNRAIVLDCWHIDNDAFPCPSRLHSAGFQMNFGIPMLTNMKEASGCNIRRYGLLCR